MNKSPIDEMYSGKKGHHETVGRSPEDEALLDEVVALDEELQSKLRPTPELFELYKKTNDAIEERNSAAADHHYKEGFKFGARLILEIVYGK